MLNRNVFLVPIAATLMTLIACHGGGSSGTSSPSGPAAHALSYTDPTAGGYRFVQNATLSTSNHLVLDLVAPSSETGAGVALELQGDTTRMVWTRVATGDAQLVQNGTVLAPGPSLVQSSTLDNRMQVLVAQAGTGSPATFSRPILRIAVDPLDGAATGTISLSAPKGQVTRGDGSVSNVSISVGTLIYK